MVHEDPSTEATQKLPKERMFRKTSNGVSFFEFYRRKLRFDKFLRLNNIGVILLEFAIALPLLMIVLYASADIPRYFLWRFKVENASRYAASMIQNTASGTFVKAKDLRMVSHAAFLNIYVGNQNIDISTQEKMPHGHNSSLHVYCVNGVQDSKGKILWGWVSNKARLSPKTRESGDAYQTTGRVSIVPTGLNSETDEANIFKDLRILKDEVKIIVEAGIVQAKAYSDGADTAINPRRMLGFFIMPVFGEKMYMGNAIVFTPQDGAFSANSPNNSDAGEAAAEMAAIYAKEASEKAKEAALVTTEAQTKFNSMMQDLSANNLDDAAVKKNSLINYLTTVKALRDQVLQLATKTSQEAAQANNQANNSLNKSNTALRMAESAVVSIEELQRSAEEEYTAAENRIRQERLNIESQVSSLLANVKQAADNADAAKALADKALTDDNIALASDYMRDVQKAALLAESMAMQVASYADQITWDNTKKNSLKAEAAAAAQRAKDAVTAINTAVSAKKTAMSSKAKAEALAAAEAAVKAMTELTTKQSSFNGYISSNNIDLAREKLAEAKEKCDEVENEKNKSHTSAAEADLPDDGELTSALAAADAAAAKAKETLELMDESLNKASVIADLMAMAQEAAQMATDARTSALTSLVELMEALNDGDTATAQSKLTSISTDITTAREQKEIAMTYVLKLAELGASGNNYQTEAENAVEIIGLLESMARDLNSLALTRTNILASCNLMISNGADLAKVETQISQFDTYKESLQSTVNTLRQKDFATEDEKTTANDAMNAARTIEVVVDGLHDMAKALDDLLTAINNSDYFSIGSKKDALSEEIDSFNSNSDATQAEKDFADSILPYVEPIIADSSRTNVITIFNKIVSAALANATSNESMTQDIKNIDRSLRWYQHNIGTHLETIASKLKELTYHRTSVLTYCENDVATINSPINLNLNNAKAKKEEASICKTDIDKATASVKEYTNSTTDTTLEKNAVSNAQAAAGTIINIIEQMVDIATDLRTLISQINQDTITSDNATAILNTKTSLIDKIVTFKTTESLLEDEKTYADDVIKAANLKYNTAYSAYSETRVAEIREEALQELNELITRLSAHEETSLNEAKQHATKINALAQTIKEMQLEDNEDTKVTEIFAKIAAALVGIEEDREKNFKDHVELLKSLIDGIEDDGDVNTAEAENKHKHINDYQGKIWDAMEIISNIDTSGYNLSDDEETCIETACNFHNTSVACIVEEMSNAANTVIDFAKTDWSTLSVKVIEEKVADCSAAANTFIDNYGDDVTEQEKTYPEKVRSAIAKINAAKLHLDTWYEYKIGDPYNNYNLQDVCYGNEKFVAVGSLRTSTKAAIFTSIDGISWSMSVSEASVLDANNSICCGNGKFMVVGNSSHVWTSSDGLSWNSLSVGVDGEEEEAEADLMDVCYGNGKFVAVSITKGKPNAKRLIVYYDAGALHYGTIKDGNRLAKSKNTATIDGYDVPVAGLLGVCYCGDKFVAVGSGNVICSSTDGATWGLVDNCPEEGENCFLGVSPTSPDSANFMAIGTEKIFSSDQPSQNDLASMPEFLDSNNKMMNICYGLGCHVATRGNIKYISTIFYDGSTWTAKRIGLPGDAVSCNKVCYGNGKFVAVGDNGTIHVSGIGANTPPNGSTDDPNGSTDPKGDINLDGSTDPKGDINLGNEGRSE
ncbi:MAG: pilus assembly protein [Holosporaceae bacterium]|nr:pilus assembly protein [Holosporaceae bacterium]